MMRPSARKANASVKPSVHGAPTAAEGPHRGSLTASIPTKQSRIGQLA